MGPHRPYYIAIFIATLTTLLLVVGTALWIGEVAAPWAEGSGLLSLIVAVVVVVGPGVAWFLIYKKCLHLLGEDDYP